MSSHPSSSLLVVLFRIRLCQRRQVLFVPEVFTFEFEPSFAETKLCQQRTRNVRATCSCHSLGDCSRATYPCQMLNVNPVVLVHAHVTIFLLRPFLFCSRITPLLLLLTRVPLPSLQYPLYILRILNDNESKPFKRSTTRWQLESRFLINFARSFSLSFGESFLLSIRLVVIVVV